MKDRCPTCNHPIPHPLGNEEERERNRHIAARRKEGATLDVIAHEFSLTRERVRQIVKRASTTYGPGIYGLELAQDYRFQLMRTQNHVEELEAEVARLTRLNAAFMLSKKIIRDRAKGHD